MGKSPEPKQLPPEYYYAIGKLTVEFAALEFTLTYLISLLTSPTTEYVTERFRRTLCFVGGESVDILLSKLDKLFHHWVTDDDLLKRFKTVIERLDTLNRKRNRYVHTHIWASESGGKISASKFLRKMTKKGSLGTYEIVPLENLNSLVDDLLSKQDELFDLIVDNFHSIKSQWKERYRELEKKIK